MDHMRISGTEPSSVILSQKIFSTLKRDVPNMQKEAEAKREGVINPQNYNFQQANNGSTEGCSKLKRPETRQVQEF